MKRTDAAFKAVIDLYRQIIQTYGAGSTQAIKTRRYIADIAGREGHTAMEAVRQEVKRGNENRLKEIQQAQPTTTSAQPVIGQKKTSDRQVVMKSWEPASTRQSLPQHEGSHAVEGDATEMILLEDITTFSPAALSKKYSKEALLAALSSNGIEAQENASAKQLAAQLIQQYKA